MPWLKLAVPAMLGAPMSVSCCAGRDADVTDTFETVALVNRPPTWLVTASPTYAVVPRAIVALPADDQLVPFADEDAVTSVPFRVSRTHRGLAIVSSMVESVNAAV